MCDRSKVEVLARELCIEYLAGLRKATRDTAEVHQLSTSDYVEKWWKHWEAHATKLIEVLDDHD